MPNKRILILGGTGQARELATKLVGLGHDVTTSLAGVTEEPILPPGKVRQGGFGGVNGLSSYLKETDVELLIDATHAFAAQMSRNAFASAEATRVPLVRLIQAPWRPIAGDIWINASDTYAAVAEIPADARLMLTIGRKEIEPFLQRVDLGGVVRMIEAPDIMVPVSWHLQLVRPPFTLEAEKQLMTEFRITHLVTKNSGGKVMATKLEAARDLKIPVIMIARPSKPKVRSFQNMSRLLAAIAT